MLAHWPQRTGLGDAYSDAQAALSGHASVNLDTLQAAAGLSPDTVLAQGQRAYAQLSGSLQNQWANATSPQQNNARIAAGVSSAADLLSNGYDPHNDTDNQKLIVTVAGAVSLVPGVGTVLGGAVLLLDAASQAIAKVLEDVGLIWYGCRTSGNWTIGASYNAMNTYGALPPTNRHDFASLVLPMLAVNYTRVNNCQGALQNLQVVTAAASMWNAGASGPPMTVYVPALSISTSQVFTVDRPGESQLPFAFQPASSVYDIGYFGDATRSSNASMFAVPATPPFILQLSGSTYTPQGAQALQYIVQEVQQANARQAAQQQLVTKSSTSSTELSTGAKVAAGAAVAGGAVLVGSAAYAAYTRQSFAGLWTNLLRRAKFW